MSAEKKKTNYFSRQSPTFNTLRPFFHTLFSYEDYFHTNELMADDKGKSFTCKVIHSLNETRFFLWKRAVGNISEWRISAFTKEKYPLIAKSHHSKIDLTLFDDHWNEFVWPFCGGTQNDSVVMRNARVAPSKVAENWISNRASSGSESFEQLKSHLNPLAY